MTTTTTQEHSHMIKREGTGNTVGGLEPLTVFSYKKNIMLLVRSHKTRNGEPALQLMKSKDGIDFHLWRKKISIELPSGKKEHIDTCTEFSIFHEGEEFSMSYVREKNGDQELVFATSANLTQWYVRATTKTVRERGVIVPGYTYDDRYVQFFGRGSIHVGIARNGKRWKVLKENLLTPRHDHFDSSPLTIAGAQEMDRGLFVLYDASEQTETGTKIQVGGALVASDNPRQVNWRSDTALWEGEFAHAGALHSLGAFFHQDSWYMYWRTDLNELVMIVLPDPFLATDGKILQKVNICRYEHNPILSPILTNDWEAEGAFNTAAVYLKGKVHFLYRAVGRNGLSVFGYANSKDGYTIDERLDEPAYIPRKAFEGAYINYQAQTGRKPKNYHDLFLSGYSWGGCEDPKMTVIDDRVYVTYVAHAGWPPRTAISWISTDDFLAHRWEKWSEPQLLSAPGLDSKSASILPEKIDGKYVVFHRTWPDVVVEYFDDLDFESDDKWISSTPSIPLWRENGKCVIRYGKHPNYFTEQTAFDNDHLLQQSEVWKNLVSTSKRIGARHNNWDSHKISMGAPPIKTDDGWLAIYSAVDKKDMSQYKIGAMLLDKKDPSKVLHRSNTPVIRPETWYDNDGKAGVVFPSGAVVKNDELLVYYGAGDKHTAVASAPLKTFLAELKQQFTPSLQTVTA